MSQEEQRVKKKINNQEDTGSITSSYLRKEKILAVGLLISYSISMIVKGDVIVPIGGYLLLAFLMDGPFLLMQFIGLIGWFLIFISYYRKHLKPRYNSQVIGLSFVLLSWCLFIFLSTNIKISILCSPIFPAVFLIYGYIIFHRARKRFIS